MIPTVDLNCARNLSHKKSNTFAHILKIHYDFGFVIQKNIKTCRVSVKKYIEPRTKDKNQVDDKIACGLGKGFLSFHSICQLFSILVLVQHFF